MQQATPIQPSAWYYWLAPFLLVAGISFSVREFLHGMPRLSDALTQVVVPGQATLTLKHGKLYTVYYEVHSVVNGKTYNTNAVLSGLQCQLRSMDGGNAVTLRPPPNGPTNYSVGDRSGSSFLEFSVAQDGPYDFSCAYEGRSHGRDVVLAVGYGVGVRIVKTVFLVFFGIIGGAVLAVLSFFWVYIRRDQSIARAAAERQLPTGSVPIR
jgi:hypothetical protein